MNGDEAWGGNNPTLYVAAYRHIHDIFTAAGATNVVWAWWCPNVTDTEGGNRTTMDYYPGDLICRSDGGRWLPQLGHDKWRLAELPAGFQKTSSPLLAAKKKRTRLSARCHRAETGGDKAKWIDEISFPRCAPAILLSNASYGSDINKEADWRISLSHGFLEMSFCPDGKRPFF